MKQYKCTSVTEKEEVQLKTVMLLRELCLEESDAKFLSL